MNKFCKSHTSILLTISLSFAAACGNQEPDGTSPPPPPCGGCASYEICQPSGSCGVNPNSSWYFAALSAQIAPTKANGSDWDAFGGAPDPYVLLDGRNSTTIQDTFTPTWNQGVSYTAATLLKQGVTVQVIDEDGAADDSIGGPSLVIPTESDLRRGSLMLTNFGQAQSLTIGLLPR